MNENGDQTKNTEIKQVVQNDDIHRPITFINFPDSDTDLEDSREDVVHGHRRRLRKFDTSDGEFDGHDIETLGRLSGSSVPSNPVTPQVQQRRLSNRLIQTQPSTSNAPNFVQPISQIQRTSTPVIDNMALNNTINNLVDQFDAVDLHERRQPTDSQSPEYLPPNEQIKKIHRIELLESQQGAHHSHQLSRLLSLIVNDTSPANLKALKLEVDAEAEQAKSVVKDKKEKLAAAQRIVEYYKSPVNKPVYNQAPADYKKTFHRTSPKEITSLTGLFDPKNPSTDFSHVWSKLIGYGQANYFEEKEYIDALRYILQGDAYDTFLSFEQSKESLDYIIEYFGKVYTPKRSLNAHRQEVDHFVRRKDESLEIAMLRCLVAIDRLKILYLPRNWPEARINLRRNILTQIITEDTRRFIRMEEDDILEKHGLPIDLDALITMAHKYEVQYNKAPKSEVSTVFQVASGGLSEDPQKLKTELKHLKKEIFTDKNLKNSSADILTAPVMPKRFSSDKERESRRSSREEDQRSKRQSRFDRSRDMTPEPTTSQASKPSARFASTKMDISPPPPTDREIVKYDPRAISPSYQQDSRSRSTTPIPDYRRQQDSNTSRARTPSYDGRNSRYGSQDRYRENRNRTNGTSYRNPPSTIYPVPQQPPRVQQQQQSSYRQNNYEQTQSRSQDRYRQQQQPSRYQSQGQNRSYSSDRNQQSYRPRSYSRDRESSYGRDNRDRDPRDRDRNRSYSRDRYSDYDQNRTRSSDYQNPSRNPDYDRNRSRGYDNTRDRNRESENQQSRGRTSNRDRDYRDSRERGRSPYRSQSPYPYDRRDPRSRSLDRQDHPRSSSMTRYEDISPTAKMLTVNVNPSKINRPALEN